MRSLALLLLAACTADRTVSEQPPFQCQGREVGWVFSSNDDRHCIAEHSAYLDCVVSVVHHYAMAEQTEEVLPACDAAQIRIACWRADDDAAACTGVVISIEGLAPPAADDVLIGWCLACD